MKGYFGYRQPSGKLSKKTIPAQQSPKSVPQQNSQLALQHDLQEFRTKLSLLEKEERLFALAQEWQDKSHVARTCGILRDLRNLERRLHLFATTNTAMRFLIENTLLRFQSFKTMHRRFWEAVLAYIS
jgi:hypothetical protein